MSRTPMTCLATLPSASKEQAARQAQAHGQSAEEHLSVPAADTLARWTTEEAPAAGPDPLAFWEQAIERYRLTPAQDAG